MQDRPSQNDDTVRGRISPGYDRIDTVIPHVMFRGYGRQNVLEDEDGNRLTGRGHVFAPGAEHSTCRITRAQMSDFFRDNPGLERDILDGPSRLFSSYNVELERGSIPALCPVTARSGNARTRQ